MALAATLRNVPPLIHECTQPLLHCVGGRNCGKSSTPLITHEEWQYDRSAAGRVLGGDKR